MHTHFRNNREYINTLKNWHTHDTPLPSLSRKHVHLDIFSVHVSRFLFYSLLHFFFLNRYVYKIFKALFDISL